MRVWLAEGRTSPRPRIEEHPTPLWSVRHHAWWMIHNLVAHPLLGVMPGAMSVAFHDWTSRRLNAVLQRDDRAGSPPPALRSYGRWLAHNVLVHAALGLVPCKITFRWHDRSAAWMAVPGWV